MIDLVVPMMPPRIVAIHGAVANAATWLPLQRELGESFEFIAPDLPGHGTKRDGPFQLESALNMIVELTKQDQKPLLQPTLLIGDSLGGYLAILAAARLGDAIDGLVIGSATFDLSGNSGMLMALTDIPVTFAQNLFGRERMESVVGAALKRITDPNTADAIITRGLRLKARSESITALQGIDIRSALQKINCPIYFVNGAYDIPTAWYTRVFARYAKEGYAVTLPTAWHGCMMTHPHEIAEIINTALVRIYRDKALRSRS
jgi:pimeloyl-ACP methyl ester carboxylesterase